MPPPKWHSEKGYICNCDRYMELSQGQIIQNQTSKSCLPFSRHRLNVMHAPIKFHKYEGCSK